MLIICDEYSKDLMASDRSERMSAMNESRFMNNEMKDFRDEIKSLNLLDDNDLSPGSYIRMKKKLSKALTYHDTVKYVKNLQKMNPNLKKG